MTSNKDRINWLIHELIIRYLESNSYNETAQKFKQESEARLPNNNDTDSQVEIDDLETIVRDHFGLNTKSSQEDVFSPQQLQNIDKYSVKFPNFTTPYPSTIVKLPDPPTTSLVIDTAYMEIDNRQLVLFTCADKSILGHDLEKDEYIIQHKDTVNNRLIWSYQNYILSCNMIGELVIWTLKKDTNQLQKLHSFKLHNRLITAFKISQINSSEIMIASIGFDFKLCVTKINTETWKLQEIGNMRFMTNPTCLEIQDYEDEILVFVGLLESSLINVFKINKYAQKDKDNILNPVYKIALNDSEFSHHSFYPTSIVTNGNLLVVATNHIPYMRLITVHIPQIQSQPKEEEEDDQLLPEAQIYRDLVVSNINTMASQDKFSNSIIFSRENNSVDNSGIVIVCDDGVIRGVDLQQGKLIEITNLKARPKAACLCISSKSALSKSNEKLVVCTVDKKIHQVK